MLKTGAVAAAHLMLEFHVIVLAVEPCMIRNVAALTFPLSAGLVKEIVVFSVKSWLKLLPSCKFKETTLLDEVTDVYSSEIPASCVTTPLASAVTALDQLRLPQHLP